MQKYTLTVSGLRCIISTTSVAWATFVAATARVAVIVWFPKGTLPHLSIALSVTSLSFAQKRSSLLVVGFNNSTRFT